MTNFEILKTRKIVYTLGLKNTIDTYYLDNSTILFDVDDRYFTNGWGQKWSYADYGKTWSFNKSELMELNYDNFARNDSLLEGLKLAEELILNNDLLSKVVRASFHGFYGTLYGGRNQDTLYIGCAEICKDGFLFIWGMPGPDYNIYRYEDYGYTWALTEEEIIKE